MNFDQPIAVKDIAAIYNLKIIGNPETLAIGINEIHKVRPGDITFVDVEKYYRKSLESPATIIIINKEVMPPEGKVLLVCNDPFDIYDSIVRANRPFNPLHDQFGDDLRKGEGTIIEHGVHIGHHVSIGQRCYIQAGAYIGDYTTIGNDTEIQAGAIIGTDAFYFKKKDGQYIKWRSGGKVIIGSNVVIGAGCTINRGVSGETIIGDGTKMDCLIHVGHGAVIGKNCLIAAQAGIAGKTIIGDNCVIYGQAGITQNLVIGDNVTIYAQSGVLRDLESDKTYFGSPAEEAREKFREMHTLRNIAREKDLKSSTST